MEADSLLREVNGHTATSDLRDARNALNPREFGGKAHTSSLLNGRSVEEPLTLSLRFGDKLNLIQIFIFTYSSIPAY